MEERGFYLTIKRIAGETGSVYYSAVELGKLCGIKKSRVYELLNQLLERGWIRKTGAIRAKTKPRTTYGIVDLWKINVDYYEQKKNVHNNGKSQLVHDSGQTSSTSVDTKEEQGKEKLNNTVSNGDKNLIKKIPNLNISAEERDYIKDEILSHLKDKHSEKFYSLVASKIPESVIRQALSEIKVDGAESPAKVFTYKMKRYALLQQPAQSL